MAASALFDKGLKSVCGKLLRDEDRSLYNDIVLLFEDRNRIAHRGGSKHSPDTTLKKLIISAKSTFKWLT